MLVACCLLAVGGGFAYVKLRFGQVRHVQVAGITSQAPSGPMNVLVVGSDTRAGLTSGQQQHYGNTQNAGGQRSDVIIIVHVDPATKQASMLSIPRDTYVKIAGTDHSDKINSAFNNGAAQLVQTIQNDFAIPINHYVEVNFDGFQGVVNAVGGINVYFPYPARDAETGLNVTQAGCTHLDGAAALALARSRYYEYYENGMWNTDGTSDLGRIKRQHTFLRILMAKAISAGIRNPITANSIVGSMVHDVTIDQTLSAGDIVKLVLAMRSITPSQVDASTLPTTATTINGVSDQQVQQPQAQQMIQRFLGQGQPGSAAPSVSPSSVSVEVLNGSGVAGQAGSAASALKGAGFKVGGSGDASSFTNSSSQVLYPPGKQAEAQLVQSYVGGGASVQQDSSLSGSDVTLVTGSSFTGIKAGANSTQAAPAAPAPEPYPSFDPRAC